MMDLDLEKMNAIRMATPEYNPDRELTFPPAIRHLK